VDSKDWSEAVRDPEVKLSTESVWLIIWLALAVGIIPVPSIVEGSVDGSKGSCAFFGLNPHLDGVVCVGLEVVEVYPSISSVEVTSTCHAESKRWVATFSVE
jgi:hypothetical protein